MYLLVLGLIAGLLATFDVALIVRVWGAAMSLIYPTLIDPALIERTRVTHLWVKVVRPGGRAVLLPVHTAYGRRVYRARRQRLSALSALKSRGSFRPQWPKSSMAHQRLLDSNKAGAEASQSRRREELEAPHDAHVRVWRHHCRRQAVLEEQREAYQAYLCSGRPEAYASKKAAARQARLERRKALNIGATSPHSPLAEVMSLQAEIRGLEEALASVKRAALCRRRMRRQDTRIVSLAQVRLDRKVTTALVAGVSQALAKKKMERASLILLERIDKEAV